MSDAGRVTGYQSARACQLSLRSRIWLATSAVKLLQAGVCVVVIGVRSAPLTAISDVIVGATLAGLVINFLLRNMLRVDVLRPLARSLAGARAIAAGDLSCAFDTRSSTEMGQLQRALQQMNNNLIATIRNVRANVDTMGVASRSIAAGNRELSGRTEAQAASLEETASSVEQFAATVKQNADSSGQTSVLAVAASKVARQGGAIVKVGVGMVQVQRAGASMAQVQRAGASMAQVQRAGASMAQVVASVQEVTAIMQDIATASCEQSIGVEQVNAAIAHMDQVTQRNAAMVEQGAAATRSLALEAVSLGQAVSLFMFGARAAAVPVRPKVPLQRAVAAPLAHR